jgi:hypothetical protein
MVPSPPVLRLPLPSQWRWPLPAVAARTAAWGLHAALQRWSPTGALLASAVLGVWLAWPQVRPWRRALVALGFPVSALATGLAAGAPPWVWLLPLALLASAYPLRAWGDAPLFPTPARALDGLASNVPLPPGARVLDAGCGLGDGLRALRSAWPQARVEGVEWSWPLALAARLRCPWAGVRRGDMWSVPWSGCAVVYLFQRPESMARAWAKARAEMSPGAWLVSLAFEVPGVPPTCGVDLPGGRRVMAWRIGAQSAGVRADKPR